jgi:hypothetical protein
MQVVYVRRSERALGGCRKHHLIENGNLCSNTCKKKIHNGVGKKLAGGSVSRKGYWSSVKSICIRNIRTFALIARRMLRIAHGATAQYMYLRAAEKGCFVWWSYLFS